jgi:hypothetical protein
MDTGSGAGFDATLLEGLPLNQFNWGEWNVSLFLHVSSLHHRAEEGASVDPRGRERLMQ